MDRFLVASFLDRIFSQVWHVCCWGDTSIDGDSCKDCTFLVPRQSGVLATKVILVTPDSLPISLSDELDTPCYLQQVEHVHGRCFSSPLATMVRAPLVPIFTCILYPLRFFDAQGYSEENLFGQGEVCLPVNRCSVSVPAKRYGYVTVCVSFSSSEVEEHFSLSSQKTLVRFD